MPKRTTNIGGFSIKLGPSTSRQSNLNSSRDETPFCIALLGNFSGITETTSQESISQNISQKRRIKIDRHNFNEILASFNIKIGLSLGLEKDLSVNIPINTIRDFHPDNLFNNVDLFQHLKNLRARLSDRHTFNQAAEEIQGWLVPKEHVVQTEEPPPRTTTRAKVGNSSSNADQKNLLDSIMHNTTSNLGQKVRTDNSLSLVDKFIREVGASSNIIPAADPRKEDYINAVDQAIAAHLRTILHHRVFQSVESIWRSVYFLIKNIETDSKLKLYLIDVTKQELHNDLSTQDQAETTGLFRLLCDSSAGIIPWSLIIGNYSFGANVKDAELLAHLGNTALQADATFLGSAESNMLGCSNFFESPDPNHWRKPIDESISLIWDHLRQLPLANHIGLVLPRFLLRVPYGQEFGLVKNFKFEEMLDEHCHDCYLWGNGANLVGYLIARAFSANEWQMRPGDFNQVEDLPLHYFEHRGDSVLKPCAEVYWTHRADQLTENAGLIALRSMTGRDSIRCSRFRSLAKSAALIQGRWTIE